MQSTQQKVREAVKEQQDTVRNLLQLAPVPLEEPDCRYITALLHILLAMHMLYCDQSMHLLCTRDGQKLKMIAWQWLCACHT